MHLKFLVSFSFVFFGLFYFLEYFPYHKEIADSCDDIGHLLMAESIYSKFSFYNTIQIQEIQSRLIQFLSQKYSVYEYTYVLLPHAYNINVETGKLINQYPPGVSILLSLVSFEFRKILFTVLVFILNFSLFLIPLKYLKQKEFYLFSIILFFWVSGLTFPFSANYWTVSSFAPTFGFLFLSGFFFFRNIYLSVFLLSLTIYIRFANLIHLIPYSFLFLLFFVKKQNFIKSCIYFGISILFSGLGLYLIHAYNLLGNPFLATYAPNDRTFIRIDELIPNIIYYCKTRLFFMNLIFIFLINFIYYKKRENILKINIVILLIVFFNYTFFITHQAKSGWYTYTSFYILFGILVHSLENFDFSFLNHRKLFNILSSASLVILFVYSIHLFQINKNSILNYRVEFKEKVEQYKTCFGIYDFVWSDIHSGSFYYTNSSIGFRYTWAKDFVRQDIIDWSKKNNFKQAFLLNDFDNKIKAEIQNDLDILKLKSKRIDCSGFQLLVLD